MSHTITRIAATLLVDVASLLLAACSVFDGGGDGRQWDLWVDSIGCCLDRQDTALAASALDMARAYSHGEWQRSVLDAYDALLDGDDIENVYNHISYFESDVHRDDTDSVASTFCRGNLLARLYEKAASVADLHLDMESAITLQNKAAEAAKRSKSWSAYFRSEQKLLWLYERAGSLDASVSGYLDLLAECHTRHDDDGEIECLYRMCLLFLRIDDIATAQIYLDEMESVQTSSRVGDCKYWLAMSYVSNAGADSASYVRAVDALCALRQADDEVAKHYGLSIDCVTADHFLKCGHPDSARRVIGYALGPHAKVVNSRPSHTFLKIFEAKLCVREGRLDRARAIIGEISPASLRYRDIYLYELYADAAGEYYAAVGGEDKLAYNYVKSKAALLDSLRIEMTTNGLALKTLEDRRDSTISTKVRQIDRAENKVESVIIGQYLWLIFAVACVVLAIVAHFVVSFRRARRRKADLENQRDKLVQDVKSRKDQILEHKWQLESKNKSTQSELFFAKYIQSNILSRESILSSPGVAEHFVFFRPCYQVSGDFYWFFDSGDKLFVCAADATGHGIPGAFISMVASATLTDIASNTCDLTPATLLEELSVSLSNVLRNNTDIVNADSVDMSVLCIDRNQESVSIAMARHVAYIVKADGSSELVQGTKRCVGEVIEVEDGRPFANTRLDVVAGDSVYIASDGFVSQFGGPENQKFKRKRLEALLAEVHSLPADEQKEVIGRRFDEWKGSCDQTDDVLLIGVRIGKMD
ncbi:MAG: PP2C family protein-serine/threonine phosphatase [Marinilabiliaceae bacterium]